MNSNKEEKIGEITDHDNSHELHRHGRRHFWKIPFFIAAIVLVKSVVFMLLWNGLIPDLFHGPNLTYMQAIGLCVLVKVLVGFGPRHFGGSPFAHFGRGMHMRRHWAKLSPEEREKLRETLRKKWMD